MIDPASAPPVAHAPPPDSGEKVLRWRKNERMGGMVPVWETRPASAQTAVEDRLTQAATGRTGENFAEALAYAQTGHAQDPYDNAQEFGFGDLIDMVNPLQHIPVVGHLYREITGDEIRPIARIVGGGVFGGVAGAAGGLIDTIVEYETGRSVTGNVIALVTEGETPQYRSMAQDSPEKRLTAAIASAQEDPNDLPGTVIGFADLGGNRSASYEQVAAADGRTAGKSWRKAQPAPVMPAREPITELSFSPMPPARAYKFND